MTPAPLHSLAEAYARCRCLDLSVTLERGIPRWPTHPHLVIDPTVTHPHDGYYCQSISMAEHCGTHMDAPCHAHAELMDQTVETLSPTALIGPAAVVDLAPCGLGPGETATLDQVRAALEQSGTEVAQGDILLVHFGWMRYWSTGAEWKHYATNQPGLGEDVADWVMERGVKAVGTDTIAVGTPVKDGVAGRCFFHERVLKAGILLVESLARRDELPGRCFFIAAPLKIRAGSGSPIRALALVDREEPVG
ncbi:MAG: cyclase family protein [Puniceicoccaceae bacterium]|nr:MAG: cyclase family protein [Puniceicoccaceae bacterium]